MEAIRRAVAEVGDKAATARRRRPWLCCRRCEAAAGGRDFDLGERAIVDIEIATEIYHKRAQKRAKT